MVCLSSDLIIEILAEDHYHRPHFGILWFDARLNAKSSQRRTTSRPNGSRRRAFVQRLTQAIGLSEPICDLKQMARLNLTGKNDGVKCTILDFTD